MKYYVKLLGGIGNVIQQVPFMLSLKEAGHEVVAIKNQVDFIGILDVVGHCYDSIVPLKSDFSDGIGPRKNKYGGQKKRKMAEHRVWFETYEIPYPGPDQVPYYPHPDLMNDAATFDSCDVLISPTSKPNWPMKFYPEYHWSTIISELQKQGVRVGVLGQEGDGQNIEIGDSLDLRGKLTLKEVAQALAQVKVSIANECGLAHLSTLVGTPTLIMGGGTIIKKNIAVRNAIVLSAGLPCQPCLYGSCLVTKEIRDGMFRGCRDDNKVNGYVRCLHELDPNHVVEQTISRLT